MGESGSNIKPAAARSPIYKRCRSAFRDAFPVWLALVAVTSLPYVVAAARTPSGHVFSGVLTAYDDTFSYLAWIRQASAKGWLMCDLYTSEPQSPEFFLPLWLGLGKISSITGAPPVWVFHAARLLACFLLLLAARSVIISLMKSRRRVRFSLWLYAMSGGIGWLVFLLRNNGRLFEGDVTSGSVDLSVPEAIAFRSAFAQVHFTLGAALVALAIGLVFRSLQSGRFIRAIAGGLLTTLLAVIHPYLVVVVAAVVAASVMFWPLLSTQQRKLRIVSSLCAGLGFGLAALPGVGYLFYLNRANEVLQEWLRVTDTFSPAPMEYAAGFGIVLLLAVAGFRLLWVIRGPKGRLLLVWSVVQAALLYAPVSYQRRFVEGLQLPLCIAASVAIFWLVRSLRLSKPTRAVLLAILVTVASLTNAGFIVGQLVARGDASGASDPRRYLSDDLVSATTWLAANADPDSVVLSSYITGNIVPPMTGLQVFLGHYGQTLHSDEKGAQVTAFYRGELSDEAMRLLLAENRVRYVIYGPLERAISDEPSAPVLLSLAYQSGGVRVFKVVERIDGRSTR